MTRKNKARYGLARSYRIKPTVKILRATIVASALATSAAIVCAAPLPPGNTGISVYEPIGDVVISNINDYSVYASSSAIGIAGKAGNGGVTIENSGNLDVYANADGYSYSSSALGIYANISVADEIHISNSGDLSVTAHTDANGYYSADARGIKVFASAGESIVINNGSIDIDVESSGISFASGINFEGLFGTAEVQNYGDISINAKAGGLATLEAISTYAMFGEITIENSGDLNITLEGNDRAWLNGIVANTFYGAEVVNSGDISLNSFANSDSVATAINTTTRFNYSSISNTGDLTVVSDSVLGRATARGIFGIANYDSVILNNSGEIHLVSESEQGSAYAAGIVAYSNGDTQVVNSGDIYIGVSSNVSGNHSMSSYANAILGYGYDLLIENDGNIWMQGFAENGDIEAAGIKGVGRQFNTNILNAGDISVFLSNIDDGATSTGISLIATYDAIIENTGDLEIVAESDNGIAKAYGMRALSQFGFIEASNAGSIMATSESGIANAVSLNGFHGVSFTNTGDIKAIGDNAVAISSNLEQYTYYGTDIVNKGKIHGDILTGAGDDMLQNDASGSIFLSDSTIDLGDGENAFVNLGELFADGDANLINIGAGNVFTNNGNSIHMDDGAADDSLTIVGDFNGTGGVFVDVDGASLTADTLFIDGNVLTGTANTVSINFVTPVDFSDITNGSEITIISVTGNSTASNFVLNPIVGGANGLYTFDYSLNYSQGDYSLAFDFGMSGLGALATTLSPALQSIWYNSMGTVYQREGSARSFLGQGEDSGGGVWTRVYGADGSYVPDATKNNFGGSTTANFDMSGIGLDAGVGYAFNQQFVVGAILGTTDTDVTPEAGGEATVSATSVGAYVSYLPGNGFYGDLYYRWMDFDGDGTFGADRIDYQGKAYGFSFEFGYAFDTASGFRIEPQLQYSDMKVDLDDISYNGTAFVLNDGDSSQLRAGLALSKDYKADWGKWTPYGALSYVDISGGSNDYDISGVLEGSVDMSGSSGLLEVGVTADIGDWILAGGFNWQDGGAVDSVFSGQLNVKYTW